MKNMKEFFKKINWKWLLLLLLLLLLNFNVGDQIIKNKIIKKKVTCLASLVVAVYEKILED